VKRILVNAINLLGAGAQTIGVSLLPELTSSMSDSSFVLLLPDQDIFRNMEFPRNSEVIFMKRRHGIRNDIHRLRDLFLYLPYVARQKQSQICLSLGDLVPVGMPCPDLVLLHQPLLVYDNRELGNLHGWSTFKRLYLTTYFAWTSSWPRFIVQTPVMAARLTKRYGVEGQRIAVISQPVPKHIAQIGGDAAPPPAVISNQKPIKLLFLAAYYPHKNHAILFKVVDELRQRGISDRVQIFVTLDDAAENSAQFRKQLENYSDVITNLGKVSWQQVAATYRASTALFLPTLVESYGIIYLEAMACGVPIVTSDRDFARWICQDLAVYFDPLNPVDIVNAILTLPKIDIQRYQIKAQQHLTTFPRDWDEVARMYAELL
jgi:glycosyltransferase involved in cell wall biosynthesis